MKKLAHFLRYEVLPARIQFKLDDWKDKHISIGRLRYGEDGEQHIVGIDWDVHWQTDYILAVIIRDYLKFFREKNKIIGNCVIKDNEFGLTYKEASERKDLMDGFAEEWYGKIEEAADAFDELIRKVIRPDDFDNDFIRDTKATLP